MAFGLAPLSQSYKADMRMIGGIVTGSSGEFLALPISSTVLQGLSGLTTNEWSRFYLSDSFGAASASVIQALNYLSASMDATSGDVSGPASSTDNAVVRFDGTGGKTIQNSTLVTFTDAGAFTGGAGGASYTLAANGQISGTNAVVAGTTVSGAGAVSGKSLTTEEATISVAGAYSGSGGITGQSLTISNLFKATSDGSITGSGLATFSNTEVAQGGGYKPALIISSSEISTAANAALIPRFIIQGTNNEGGLADFMISVSGGMFQVQELSNGTWPV